MPEKAASGNEKLRAAPPNPLFSRMSKVTKLLHTRYRVNDLERTVKFYRDILGLEEIKRHKSPRGSELVFLKAPEARKKLKSAFSPAANRCKCSPTSRISRSRWTASRNSQTPRQTRPEILRRPDDQFQRHGLSPSLTRRKATKSN
jgi:hypothetical protein